MEENYNLALSQAVYGNDMHVGSQAQVYGNFGNDFVYDVALQGFIWPKNFEGGNK